MSKSCQPTGFACILSRYFQADPVGHHLSRCEASMAHQSPEAETIIDLVDIIAYGDPCLTTGEEYAGSAAADPVQEGPSAEQTVPLPSEAAPAAADRESALPEPYETASEYGMKDYPGWIAYRTEESETMLVDPIPEAELPPSPPNGTAPSPATAEPAEEAQAMEQQPAAPAGSIEQQPTAPAGSIEQLEQRIASLESGVAGLAERIARLEYPPPDLSKRADPLDTLDALQARVAALETVPHSDDAAIIQAVLDMLKNDMDRFTAELQQRMLDSWRNELDGTVAAAAARVLREEIAALRKTR